MAAWFKPYGSCGSMRGLYLPISGLIGISVGMEASLCSAVLFARSSSSRVRSRLHGVGACAGCASTLGGIVSHAVDPASVRGDGDLGLLVEVNTVARPPRRGEGTHPWMPDNPKGVVVCMRDKLITRVNDTKVSDLFSYTH